MAKKKDLPFGEFIEMADQDETPTGIEEFDTEQPLPPEPPIFYKDIKIKQINVKVHGLMPEDEKKAIQMIADGVPLAEVADNFGIARSDIAYTNKAK